MRVLSLSLNLAVSIAIAGVVSTPLEAAQSARPAYTREVQSGKAAVIYNAYQLGEDCKELRPPVIKIVSPPQHGTAIVSRTTHQPSYETGNLRYKCNKLAVPMTVVTYRPSRGYVGTDLVKFHTDLVAPGDTSSSDTSVTLQVR